MKDIRFEIKPESYIWFEICAGGMLGMVISSSLPYEKLGLSFAVSTLIYFFLLYLFIFIGVVLVGFFQFKSINRLNKFRKATIQCLLGLVISVIFYFLMDTLISRLAPNADSWPSLSILIPLIGAAIGLNFIFLKAKKISDLS